MLQCFCAPCLTPCATLAAARRLRIAEFARDYDKRRSGFITTSQFHRTLDMCNVELTDADVALLEAKYGSGDGRVNYKAFQTTIDESFTPSGLEQNPTAAIKKSFVPESTMPVLAAAEDVEVEAILDRIAEYIATRKVLARPAFVEHEQDQNSVMIINHVTAYQFAQTLSRLNVTSLLSLTPAQVKLVGSKYDDRGDGTVNWAEFLARVDSFGVDPITGPPKPFPSEREMEDVYDMADSTAATAEVQALVNKIALECRVNSIRVHDFFADFDKLRANSIPYKKFCSGLAMALEKTTKFALSPSDFLALGEHFKADTQENKLVGHPDGRANLRGVTYFHQYFVRWMDFCNEVDSANTIKGLENAPLGNTTRDFGASRPAVTENELGVQALESIKTQVKKQGILVKHFFQDFAQNQNSVMITNHVTHGQFEQCIARLMFDVTREEIFAIAKMFSGRGDGTVNYRAFVEAVDPAPPSINPWKTCELSHDTASCNADCLPVRGRRNDTVMAAEANAPAPAPAPAAAEPLSPDAEAVVEKVKAACLKYKIRIHEFFQDFDRLRRGVVTARQMEIAFNMAFDGLDVGLSPDDIQALCEAYNSDDVQGVSLQTTTGIKTAVPYYSSNFVRWHDLADAVDSVFTTKGLASMSPSLNVSTGLQTQTATTSELSEGEEALASEASARIKQQLDTQRIQLAPFFQDFCRDQNSPMRVHCVTETQFAQVLAMLKLTVSVEETKALLKKYDTTGEGFVNYHNFCEFLQPPPPHINPWKTTVQA